MGWASEARWVSARRSRARSDRVAQVAGRSGARFGSAGSVAGGSERADAGERFGEGVAPGPAGGSKVSVGRSCESAWRGERAASGGACGADRVAGQPEDAGPAQQVVGRSPSRRRWGRTCRRGSARVLGLKSRRGVGVDLAGRQPCVSQRRGSSARRRRWRGWRRGGRGSARIARRGGCPWCAPRSLADSVASVWRSHFEPLLSGTVALVADWRALSSCDEPRQPCFAFASAFVAVAAYHNATPRPIQPSPRSAIGTSKSRSLTVSSAAPAIRRGKAARPIASGSDS